MKKSFITLALLGLCNIAYASDENILNLYTWSGVIPDATIQQFEKETGIKVNFSTYENNETLYAKLKTNRQALYDVIEPSSYFIHRMQKNDMLEKIDHSKLSNYSNLDPVFLNQSYDPHSDYAIPFIWGVTGIYINRDKFDPKSVTRWSDFWDPRFKDQLMLLDDSREAFSMALLTLGYSPNDSDPEHIEQAYEKLSALRTNIHIYKSDAVVSLLSDSDSHAGMAWNGDVYKASQENDKLNFIYPKEGFVIWVDTFAIPKNAPHLANAYKFINFMLRADVDKAVSLDNNYPSPNLAARKLLPENIQHNPIIYPDATVMKRGTFQQDLSEHALALYEKYWEKLKIGG